MNMASMVFPQLLLDPNTGFLSALHGDCVSPHERLWWEYDYATLQCFNEKLGF